MDNLPNKISQSTEQTSSSPTERVFSMPARYRHGAVVHNVEPQPNVSTSVVRPPVPPTPALKPIPQLTGQKSVTLQNTKHTSRGLIIAGCIVLLALGIGGYLVMRSTQKNQQVPLNETPIVQTPVVSIPLQSSPVPEQVPAEVSVSAGSPPSPFPIATTPGVDTDSDGVTDTEETLVYKTDSRLPDTDGDGFLDGNEVFHRYNPNGTAPATLLGAGLVQLLSADLFKISYPTAWSVLPSENGGYVFLSSTGEKILITLSTKSLTISLTDWYTQEKKDGTPNAFKTKNGFPSFMEKNQLTVYLDIGSSVLTFVYDPGTKATIDYLQTFQMMLNSVEKK